MKPKLSKLVWFRRRVNCRKVHADILFLFEVSFLRKWSWSIDSRINLDNFDQFYMTNRIVKLCTENRTYSFFFLNKIPPQPSLCALSSIFTLKPGQLTLINSIFRLEREKLAEEFLLSTGIRNKMFAIRPGKSNSPV